MSIAIDYTASNGHPMVDPESFHRVTKDDKNLNQYETAILQVGNILNYYAYK